MKKLILSSLIALSALFTANAQLGQNVTTLSTSTGGTFPVLTNGCKVKYVMVSSPNAGLVQFFDNSGTNTVGGTNYITSAYTNYTQIITNTVATNYVGTTGYTNYYTNSGIWTVPVANAAATNALSPTLAFAVVGNVMGGYPTDAVFTRGVNVRTTTNTSVVIYYNNP